MQNFISDRKFFAFNFFCLFLVILFNPSFSFSEDVFLSGENTTPLIFIENCSQSVNPHVTTDVIYLDQAVYVDGAIDITLNENANLKVIDENSIYVQGSDLSITLRENSLISAVGSEMVITSIALSPCQFGEINIQTENGAVINAELVISSSGSASDQLLYGSATTGILVNEYAQPFALDAFFEGTEIISTITSADFSSRSTGFDLGLAYLIPINYSLDSAGSVYRIGLKDSIFSTTSLVRNSWSSGSIGISIGSFGPAFNGIKSVDLDNSSIITKSNLFAAEGYSSAIGYIDRTISQYGGTASLSVHNGSVISSTAFAEGYNAVAVSTGLGFEKVLAEYQGEITGTPQVPMLDIAITDSEVSATTTVKKTGEDPYIPNPYDTSDIVGGVGRDAYSYGISLSDSYVRVPVSGNMIFEQPDPLSAEVSIALSGAKVLACATSEGEGFSSESHGISLTWSSPDIIDNISIILSNSQIVAEATTTDPNSLSISYGIYALGINKVVGVSVDQTSSITGQWSIWGDSSTFAVNNYGLLDGRLKVTNLTNGSSGRLGATLSGTSSSRIFDNNALDAEPYFAATTATLNNGSTFLLKSSDLFGLTSVNDTISYRLFYADLGEWSQNINDLQLVTDSVSPMVSVNWSDLSDSQNLIVTTQLLSPAEAGLSMNAQAAALAALADGIFEFDSSPEDWTPGVSGALTLGTTAGLRHFSGSIRTRINGMRGINSGDETNYSKGLWLESGYSDADQNNRNSIRGFNAQSTHYSIGYDLEGNNALFGIAYTHSESDINGNSGSLNIDSNNHLFSLYGHYDFDNVFIQAFATFGRGNMDSFRIAGAQLLETDIDSQMYAISSQIGFETVVNNWQITPVLSFEYDKQHFDDYQETGGSLALDVDSQNYEIFNIGGGATLKRSWTKGWGNITPELTAMLYYDVIGDRVQSVSRFVGGQTSFVTNGSDPAQTSWEISPSVTIGTTGDYPMKVKLSYTYSGKEDFQASSISGELRFVF